MKAMKIRRLFLLMIIVFSAASCEKKGYLGSPVKGDSSSEDKTAVVLWKAGDKTGEMSYVSYRIPTLLKTADKLFAFIEARTSDSDAGDIDIAYRVSSDNGKSWSEARILVSDDNNTCGNPCAVYTSEGSIIMMFNWQYTAKEPLPSSTLGVTADQVAAHNRRVFTMRSEDDGQTWSKPVDVTSQVMEDSWTWNAVGPCHAIQLKGEAFKGRIVFPCDMKFHSGTERNDLAAYTVYSDDNGQTWQKSNLLNYGNESTVVERSDGKLHLDMRNANSAYYEDGFSCRAYSLSSDGGASWGEYSYDRTRPEPTPASGGTKGCQGAIINYSSGVPSSKVIFCNPANDLTRSNLTLRFSNNNGLLWQSSLVVYKGFSGYSDLAVLDDGSLVVFYENGKRLYDDQVSVKIISKEEIEKHFQ